MLMLFAEVNFNQVTISIRKTKEKRKIGRTGLQKRGKRKLKQLAVLIKGWIKKRVG